MSPRSNARVAVAAATYQRPEMLARLLESLRHLRTPEPFDVVIVDNDPAGTAMPYLTEAQRSLPFRLLAVHEPEPGISAARNAALDAAAGHELLAFIDDDETADPGWLEALLAMQTATGAAAVTGPVEYSFAVAPPRWSILGGFYMEPGFAHGDDVPIAGTNNLLLDLGVLRSMDLRFDPRFGLIGGSDIVLTRALTDAGHRIMWAADAVVDELVPERRCRRHWLVRRAVRTGNSYALMLLGRRSNGSVGGRAALRAALFATGVLRIASGAVRIALHPAVNRDPRGAAGLRTLLRGVGVLGAAAGHRVAEYARVS